MALYFVSVEQGRREECKAGIREIFNRHGGNFGGDGLERLGLIRAHTTAEGAKEIAALPGVIAVEANNEKKIPRPPVRL